MSTLNNSFLNKFKGGHIQLDVLWPIFCIIFLVVIVFNWVSIFGLEILLLDDNFRYINAVEDKINLAAVKRNPLYPFISQIFYELMSFSPNMARFFIVVLFLVPISCLFFLLCHRSLGLPATLSFVVAVIPNILPGQELIPAFIDGAYPLYGLFFILLAFLRVDCYLKNKRKRELFFIIFCYVIASLVMDHAVFFVIPLLFYIIFRAKNIKAYTPLIGSVLLISVLKFLWIKLYPWAVAVPVELSVAEKVKRLFLYVQYATPYPFLLTPYWGKYKLAVVILISVLCLLGVIFSLLEDRQRVLPIRGSSFAERFPYLFSMLFAVVWATSTMVAFILVSPSFPSRYSHISSFGLNLAILLSVYVVSKYIFKKIRLPHVGGRIIFILLLCGLIVASGMSRNEALGRIYARYNHDHRVIKSSLAEIDYPFGSQIVIVGKIVIPTGGLWHWSRGYLKFTTQREDIEGLLPKERNFYNPFDMSGRKSWADSKRMTGLDEEGPVFLFRYHYPNAMMAQVEYCLKWLEPDNPHSRWEVFQVDKTSGSLTVKQGGVGVAEYLNYVRKAGLGHKVLWGNIDKLPKHFL